jgi:glutaconate CoA-transferase subunit B
MFRVVTDLAVFAFDETTHAMKVISLNPGVTRDQVQANTGFEVAYDPDFGTTEPPTEHELRVLRTYDPERLFTA